MLWVKSALLRPVGCAWIMMRIISQMTVLFLKSVLLLPTLQNGSIFRQTERQNVLKMIPTLLRPLGIINTTSTTTAL